MILRFLRQVLGWSDLASLPTESCVLVAGHTSYWDGCMAMLYSSEMILRFPMKPEMFEGYFTCLAPLFKWFGFFPAPKYENRGSGGVQSMIDRL